MIMFPGFQALDVFGPLDALNILSWQHKMNLSLIADTLEPVSTKAVSATMNRFNSSFGESVLPTHTFATAPPLDVLIVPGGVGTRSPNITSAIAFVKAQHPRLKYLITVCTGAGIAARAGVLDGKRATTNKRSWAQTVALGPKVHWIAHARWVVDGRVYSGSGVSAGIDVTLAWIADVFGEEIAKGIANGMEYERHLDPSWDPFAELYNLTDVRPQARGLRI
jgi:transcriptional regulator GlxA family with amidase domain